MDYYYKILRTKRFLNFDILSPSYPNLLKPHSHVFLEGFVMVSRSLIINPFVMEFYSITTKQNKHNYALIYKLDSKFLMNFFFMEILLSPLKN